MPVRRDDNNMTGRPAGNCNRGRVAAVALMHAPRSFDGAPVGYLRARVQVIAP